MQMRHDTQTATCTIRVLVSCTAVPADTSQLCTVIKSFPDIFLTSHGRIMTIFQWSVYIGSNECTRYYIPTCFTCIEKNKTKYLLKGTNKWEPGKRAQYLELLTRKECNAIFSARTRMLNVNGNYHNRKTDPTCRACGNKTETQEHILEECPALMDDKN